MFPRVCAYRWESLGTRKLQAEEAALAAEAIANEKAFDQDANPSQRALGVLIKVCGGGTWPCAWL